MTGTLAYRSRIRDPPPAMHLAAADSLITAGVIDSTGILEVITFLESEYGISIGDAEMTPDNLETIERTASFVVQKQSAAAR
jgi:acyl carrier protein